MQNTRVNEINNRGLLAMVKLLHTGDIHLGRQFPSLRNKADEYRNQLVRTFEKIIDLAVTEKVSLLLIAGDLFDANRIYGLTIGKVIRKLETLDIKVCIIPGTHDAYGEDSIYRSLRFPPNVTVFTPGHSQQTYTDLDLTVYGLVPEGKAWQKSPLQGLTLAQDSRFHVGMAHCSIRIGGVAKNDAGAIDKDEIAGSGLDYLALGHWHSFQDFSQGRTIACYSGSPEPIDMDQKGAGNVVLVTLDEGKAGFQAVQVGTKKCDSVTIDASPVESIDGIVQMIEARSDPNLILQVNITGGIDYEVNCQKMESELGGQFFNLRLEDMSHPKPEAVKLGNYPDKTVIGRYLRIIEGKMAAATGQEDKSMYEEALKLGYALLQGHPEVID